MSRNKAAASSGAAGGPDGGLPGIAPDRTTRRRSVLRRWRVPTRLAALLVIPVVVALVFAGLRVADQVVAAREAGDAQRVARLALSATTLADRLQSERDRAAASFTPRRRSSPESDRARRATDAALAGYRKDAGGAPRTARIRARIATADAALAKLPAVRAAAYRDPRQPLATQRAYSAVFAPLPAFDNELGLRTGNVTSRARALYALSLTKASLSTQRSLVSRILVDGRESPNEVAAILASRQITDTARKEFLAGALPEDVTRYRDTVRSPDIRRTTQLGNAVLAAAGTQRRPGAGAVTGPDWFRTASTEIALTRQVERALTHRMLQDATAARDGAIRSAVLNAAAALAALLVAAVFALAIARSMVRAMRTLRTGALDVADYRLPALVSRLSSAEPGPIDKAVEPIAVHGDDEIAEVARAFDAVHREAVRLAGEQALLRGNVNAIFTNLSRRSQGLIERQLSLITDLENNEADPDQLASLFRLDHLATRMRRNGENLLVLAGEDAGRRWAEPVPLVDVCRAAASEVEQYERIMLEGVPEAEVRGPAVTDLVHLLSELLENATSFSSPNTNVRITGARLQDGRVLVEIHDEGIGLSDADFQDINDRLSRPPTVDAAVSRRMGLFVVGRLAARHGVRVQLRLADDGHGTTCVVMLPEEVTGPAVPAAAEMLPPASPGRHSRRAPAPEPGLPGEPGLLPDPGDPLLRRLGGIPQPPLPGPAVYGQGDMAPGPYPGVPESGWSGAETGSYPAPDQPEQPYVRQEFDQFGGVSPASGSPFATGMMPEVPAPQPPLEDDGVGSERHPEEGRNPTDDPWLRTEPVRRPPADGTTPSGLPRRAPRPDPPPGAAEETNRHGPPVSRTPDEVRGRLTDLHRGIRQGRHAGEDPGPNPHQEQQ